MSALSIYQSPTDIALKLFREAGRMLNAKSIEDVADHLFNFCVTNTALRDWTFKTLGKKTSDATAIAAWRAEADNLFGNLADIGNSGKHFSLKPQQAVAQDTVIQTVALSHRGIHPEMTKTQPTFLIVLPDGSESDLWKVFAKVNQAWEEIFQRDLNITLPASMEFICTASDTKLT